MTIQEQASQMIASAKKGTVTFKEAMAHISAYCASMAVESNANEIYGAAIDALFAEMYDSAHGGSKETAALGATESVCCINLCENLGTLQIDDENWICDNCAQIQNELAP
ncbi:hypothetical protein SAMN04487969_102469 [Paenibacillus algorifonticola]|uniref:Uncharacterized protein n=1 Tax=Paenibacillus algorifonticola TaxID=684063 RepID=A0A1I2AFP8_9BACL|nr:hypothetical protein [Paenibacillus algorifonticola]SFE42791.1 hypothetical protein SAMN04487969_102469 [Paenibacillus algorifonticola]